MSESVSNSVASELALVDETRARSVRAGQAPVWADALFAAMAAFAWALLMTWRLVPGIVGVALFVGGVLVNLRFTRRKGRVLDEQATHAHMLRYFVFMAPVIGGATLLGRGRPLWVLAVFAVVAATLMFTYLRSEARYDARRLAKGDFKPWDLV